MDADGVLWRIDLSATDPRPSDPYTGWTVRPFHDLFWDMKPADDETTYEKPILSLDSDRRLVVITGTGDTDNFDKPTVLNRVVSLTELPTSATPTGADDYTAALNWEMRVDGGNGLVASEMVTGTMALIEGQLYFGTFISVANTANACDYGRGRLWAVDFDTKDPNDPNPQHRSNRIGGHLRPDAPEHGRSHPEHDRLRREFVQRRRRDGGEELVDPGSRRDPTPDLSGRNGQLHQLLRSEWSARDQSVDCARGLDRRSGVE
jgi:hypothetical protein